MPFLINTFRYEDFINTEFKEFEISILHKEYYLSKKESE
jgi:hypothetical protein